MNIESIAKQLMETKARFDAIDSEYTRQRDQMHNVLVTQPDCTYTWNGYKFTKFDAANVISVNKESVINALHSAGLKPDVIGKILNDALIERERGPGVRITAIQA